MDSLVDRPPLEETTALLEATLDATDDALVVVDLNRRVIRSNRHFADMSGMSHDEIAAGGLDAVVQRLAGQLENPDALAAMAHDGAADPPRRVDVLRFRDGRVFERHVAPLQFGSRIIGRVESFRDVTDPVRTAQSLDE